MSLKRLIVLSCDVVDCDSERTDEYKEDSIHEMDGWIEMESRESLYLANKQRGHFICPKHNIRFKEARK